jgi:phosphate butyryltransferase
MFKNFNDLVKEASRKKTTICVAAAEDQAVLEAVKMATDFGMVESLLVGDSTKIKKIAEDIGLVDYDIIHCDSPEDSVAAAVKAIRDNKAHVLMKGLVNTSVYLRGILNRQQGLRTGRLLSLVAVYELPGYHKLIYATDSGVNVAPNLEQKKEILINTLTAMNAMGFENPKVAALTANENVDPKVSATVDAAGLVTMVEKGEIPPCVIEGPIAFDVAFSKEAAEHKGIDSKIAGDLDVLLFPNIETGNALGKSWLHFNNAKWAGIVLGATHPIILGSRSDTPEIKLNSIALGCLSANKA